MAANKDITILSIEVQSELNLEELCEACCVSQDFICELVEYGAIEPTGISADMWRFSPEHVRKIKTVQNLQQDLEVNLPGAALAIDLLDQIERMRMQLMMFERYFSFNSPR